MSNDIDLPVRQAAVIYLKNMVSDKQKRTILYIFFGNLSAPFIKRIADKASSLTEGLWMTVFWQFWDFFVKTKAKQVFLSFSHLDCIVAEPGMNYGSGSGAGFGSGSNIKGI